MVLSKVGNFFSCIYFFLQYQQQPHSQPHQQLLHQQKDQIVESEFHSDQEKLI